jgi:hypothetical protein
LNQQAFISTLFAYLDFDWKNAVASTLDLTAYPEAAMKGFGRPKSSLVHVAADHAEPLIQKPAGQ